MSLNNFVDLIEKPWMDIGCRNLTVYGAANFPNNINSDAIHVNDGTLVAPSISYQSDVGTGLLLVAPGNPALSVSGSDVIDVLGQSVRINKQGTNLTNPLCVRLNTAQGQDVGNTIATFQGSGERVRIIDQDIAGSVAPQLQFVTGLGGQINTIGGGGGNIEFHPNAAVSSVLTAKPASVGVADGTVALPAVHFNSDINNGLYKVGADDIAVSAGGVIGLELKKGTNVDVVVGSQVSLPAASVDGFFYICNVASLPVGIPAGHPNSTAICFDPVAKTMYAFAGGAWRSSVFV